MLPEQFKSLDVKKLQQNPFSLFDDEWLLLTAGNLQSFNTMTISWGFVGILWNKPMAICFVRPHRYTYQFMERCDYFTLTSLLPEFKMALDICGSVSGKHTDKVKQAGITPFETGLGNISFHQAKLILECKKAYFDDLHPEHFLNPEIQKKIYPSKDFHRFYMGEVINAYGL